MNEKSDLIVETSTLGGAYTLLKEYTLPVGLVIVLIAILFYCSYKETFASPDGVVARKSKKQKRDDPEVDDKWNRREFEKAVAALNDAS